MIDPVSLTLLGSVGLTEGVKFLYTQATELLQQHRDSRAAAAGPATVPAVPDGVLDGSLSPVRVDYSLLAVNADRLLVLRRGLVDYVDGLAEVDPANQQLVERIATLRGLLELLYDQHLTFSGEDRPATGSPLSVGTIANVTSYVAASGQGAVAVGGDNIGDISTATWAGGA